MESNYLESVLKQFEYYKLLGDQTIAQVPEDKLFWQYNSESNSIATIVKHLWGNMLSRWTEFLSSDGEKEWRDREAEFDNDLQSRDEVIKLWEEGWSCLFAAIRPLAAEDLDKIVYIRNQGHTVQEAINRQLAHYPYHVGQMIYIGKMVCAEQWRSLSIPRGASGSYNVAKFAAGKQRAHFTDEFLKNNKSDQVGGV